MLICIVLSIFVENIPQKVLHSAQICCTFADEITSRDGAEVARWAHNPKVVGSNPAPATKKKAVGNSNGFFLCSNLSIKYSNLYLFQKLKLHHIHPPPYLFCKWKIANLNFQNLYLEIYNA